MLIPIRKNSACFPAGATRAHEEPHPVSPVSHASRYNTLHFASKVVCQRGPPFGNPRQQNRRYAALSGSIPPFVVSSPFHGLFSPFVKFGVADLCGPGLGCDEDIEAYCSTVKDVDILRRGFRPAQSDEINVLTYHKAKGLEFDIVFC